MNWFFGKPRWSDIRKKIGYPKKPPTWQGWVDGAQEKQ